MANYKASIGPLGSFLHAQVSQLSFFLHAGSLGKEHRPHRTSDYSIRLSVSLQSHPPGISSANPDTSRLCDVYPGGPTVLH